MNFVERRRRLTRHESQQMTSAMLIDAAEEREATGRLIWTISAIGCHARLRPPSLART